ncbi:hypothetical protein MLD38_007946 [Melastoma candidum]|uniref:Uncharacterized protein n=1 Tax=Melastoma candidum TaxID=119954 RepID=A0ACB9RSQ0_9MYRT|nr:hypothetical protein MLD38_007946 [Melastoma candidum]
MLREFTFSREILRSGADGHTKYAATRRETTHAMAMIHNLRDKNANRWGVEAKWMGSRRSRNGVVGGNANLGVENPIEGGLSTRLAMCYGYKYGMGEGGTLLPLCVKDGEEVSFPSLASANYC